MKFRLLDMQTGLELKYNDVHDGTIVRNKLNSERLLTLSKQSINSLSDKCSCSCWNNLTSLDSRLPPLCTDTKPLALGTQRTNKRG